VPGANPAAGPAYWLLAALWLVTLYDPQWNLAARGYPIFLKLPVFLLVAVGISLAISAVSVPGFTRRWTWYLPLLLFILVSLVSGYFAPDARYVERELTQLTVYWTLVVGAVALVDTPRRSTLLLLAYGVQFTWWGLWGVVVDRGGVSWHPVLANYDGFGAFMVIGAGFCAFLALAADGKWIRRALMLTAGLCLVGVVASFARGAFLAAVAVGLAAWWRSPNKGTALLAGVVGVITFGVAASLLFGDAYWSEMETILQGTQEETGEDRWVMWSAGWEVFVNHPILGAGPGNWGVRATEIFRPGELGGQYTYNVIDLYDRELHNDYMTILAEVGILGISLFIWLLIDFWRRNRDLRTGHAEEVWRQLGGRLDLHYVALGLEAAMVGWMAAAFFYSLAGTHWLFTILGLNLVLHSIVSRASPGDRGPRSGPPRRGVRRPSPAGSSSRVSRRPEPHAAPRR